MFNMVSPDLKKNMVSSWNPWSTSSDIYQVFVLEIQKESSTKMSIFNLTYFIIFQNSKKIGYKISQIMRYPLLYQNNKYSEECSDISICGIFKYSLKKYIMKNNLHFYVGTSTQLSWKSLFVHSKGISTIQ